MNERLFIKGLVSEPTAEDYWADGRVLRNTRHEDYAVARASKKNKADSWRIAYGHGKDSKPCSSTIKRLEDDPSVQYRIREMRKRIANKAVQHAAIAEAEVIAGFRDLASKSSRTIPILTRDGEEIGRKCVDGAAYAKALDMMAKTLGIYREKRAASEIEDKTLSELVELYEQNQSATVIEIEEYKKVASDVE